MNMLENAELKVSKESVLHYKRLAQEYLLSIQATLDVVKAGIDENGDDIFGICLRSPGYEEWYDAYNGDPNSLAGWDNVDDARHVLENKVFPNLGYTIHCKELIKFHRNIM